MSMFTVYQKDYCPYCKKAKRMLDALGVQYTQVDVASDPVAFAEMVARSKRRTVPQVFIDDTHIGGSDDLENYLRRLARLSQHRDTTTAA